jgi:hypothetical protein
MKEKKSIAFSFSCINNDTDTGNEGENSLVGQGSAHSFFSATAQEVTVP